MTATRRFKVLLKWDAEAHAWVTYVPVLGNLSTFGDTRDEAFEQTREAILGYLEAAESEVLAGLDEHPAVGAMAGVEIEIT